MEEQARAGGDLPAAAVDHGPQHTGAEVGTEAIGAGLVERDIDATGTNVHAAHRERGAAHEEPVGLDVIEDAGDPGQARLPVRGSHAVLLVEPRSSAGPSGSELSHLVAPPSEGMCVRVTMVA